MQPVPETKSAAPEFKRRATPRPIKVVLVCLWSGLGLAMLGTTPISAMLFKDTSPFILLVLLLLALCALAPLIGLILWVRRRNARPFLWCASSWIVGPLIVLVVLQIPHRELIDAIRGEPEIVAVYVGTMSDARLTLREGGRFDEFATGFFGVTTFEEGRYERHGRELRLRFAGDRSTDPPQRVVLGEGFVELESYGRLPRLSLRVPGKEGVLRYGIVKGADLR